MRKFSETWEEYNNSLSNTQRLRREVVKSITENRNKLERREYYILIKRWRDGMSLYDVGAHYQVTRERIRQIEEKAIAKLMYE